MNNHSLIRCSHRRCSVEKGVLKNFAVFTGKHLCWSVFLIDFRPAPLSSNINEVIMAILNFFNFFFTKRFCTQKKHQQARKNTKSTKKHQKHKKQKNATKQKHKTQIREQKLKMRLKNI